MKPRSRLAWGFGLLLIGAAAVPIQAGTILFSNLGPGDSYQQRTGWSLGDTSGYDVSASAFTPGTSLELASIEVAASLNTGTNQLTISFDKNSGGIPGSTIESWTIDNQMAQFGAFESGHLVTAVSLLHPLLTAGTEYWVVLSLPSAVYTNGAWNWNSTGDTGPIYNTENGVVVSDGIGTRGAMQINGVPEPSSLVMGSMPLLALLGFVLRSAIKTCGE